MRSLACRTVLFTGGLPPVVGGHGGYRLIEVMNRLGSGRERAAGGGGDANVKLGGCVTGSDCEGR